MATSYPGPAQVIFFFIFIFILSLYGVFLLLSINIFVIFKFQVGSYFVGQYYQVLQQQPDLVHQFYSDASNMIRVDGDSSESASAMLVAFIF